MIAREYLLTGNSDEMRDWVWHFVIYWYSVIVIYISIYVFFDGLLSNMIPGSSVVRYWLNGK